MTFLIRSNIYVSLAVATLYLYYGFLLEKDFFVSTPLFVFSGTFFAYNFLRLVAISRKDSEASELKEWYKKNRLWIALFSLFLIPLIIVGALDLSRLQSFFILTGFISVIFYERFFFKKVSLRTLPYIKPIIISIVWTLICVGLHIDEWGAKSLPVVIDSFFFILFLCLLFDYKDTESDKRSKIKSIIHFKNSKSLIMFSSIFILTYCIYLAFFFQNSFSIPYAMGFIVLTFLALKNLKHPMIFCFLVDGMIIYKALFGIYLL